MSATTTVPPFQLDTSTSHPSGDTAAPAPALSGVVAAASARARAVKRRVAPGRTVAQLLRQNTGSTG